MIQAAPEVAGLATPNGSNQRVATRRHRQPGACILSSTVCYRRGACDA